MNVVWIYIRKHVLVDGLCRFSVAYTEGRGGVADYIPYIYMIISIYHAI